jgi:hypothetical protein
MGVDNYLPVGVYAVVASTIFNLGTLLWLGKNDPWYYLHLGRFPLLFYWEWVRMAMVAVDGTGGKTVII